MLRKNQVNCRKNWRILNSLCQVQVQANFLAIILAISHILPLQCTYTVSIGYCNPYVTTSVQINLLL